MRRKLSKVEKLLEAVRRKSSPTCRDRRQLDLVEFALNEQKRQAFARLDASIAEEIGGDPAA